MRTWDYLLGPEAPLFLPGALAGLAIAVQGALLSALVVLKRMAFIGQGVSHAAFGGVGVAVILGLGSGLTFPVVAGFCVLSAWGIAWATGRRSRRADTVIGVFLVGSMALGAALVALHLRGAQGARTLPPWEQILFGSIIAVGPADAWVAWGMAALTALALWCLRRPLLYWAFDEGAAEASGAPTRRVQFALLTLLAVAIVTAMKLAGIVLATALLVLPGATALRLSDRLSRVIGLSVATGVAGMGLGVALSFEADLPPGACVVLALIALYGLAGAWGALRDAARRAGPQA